MLKPITNQFSDKSTDSYFQFAFYCDRCGKEWLSSRYEFENCFPQNLTECQQRARDIMWRTEHDAAYERANHEARLHFNRCEICTREICDDCYELCVCSDGRCLCPGRAKETQNAEETEQWKKE